MTATIPNHNQKFVNLWQPFQQWLEGLEIQQAQTARHIVRLIPNRCPFAREIRVFDKVIFRIPPLCKFNPCYEQLMSLRFRALCFLADTCGEDITPYCL